ncbi:DUF4013 domain-containing protein [Persephonella sp. IF05-L8]|uniref:DUF4013 domain-containing protein n=1 Tax=Persephonella sp. IF05-L8 TaxID=1158338 RepID=UPI0004958A0F
MSLKKEEVEKELFIHFSKKELENCKIEVCDVNQVDKCIEKLTKNCCYISDDKVYALYFIYLKDNEDVLDINLIFEKKEKISNNLRKTVEKIQSKDLVRTDICIELIIFTNLNLAGKIFNKVNIFRKRTFSDSIEDKIIIYLTKPVKFFIQHIAAILSILFLLYSAFTISYLIKIGLPLDLLSSDTIKSLIETVIFLIVSALIYIFIFPAPFILLIAFFLSIVIYYLSFGSVFSFRAKRDILDSIILFGKFYLAITVIFAVLILIVEPTTFIAKTIGFKNFGKTFKKLDTNIVKIAIFEYTYDSSSDLRFVKINNSIEVLQLGTKNNLIYYYRVEDIKNILQNTLENDPNSKKCYCEKLSAIENSKNAFEDKNYKWFYILFYLPTECDIYPYEKVLKGKINTKVILNTKVDNIEDIDKSNYIKSLKNFCGEEENNGRE